jgi:hypothetical protein
MHFLKVVHKNFSSNYGFFEIKNETEGPSTPGIPSPGGISHYESYPSDSFPSALPFCGQRLFS